MTHFLRIIVATEDQASRELIARVVSRHKNARIVAEVDGDSTLADTVAHRRPQLAFVSTELADTRGLEIAGVLSRRYPGLYIVVITPDSNGNEDIRRAMKVGARECLAEPLREDAIVRVIEEAREIVEESNERKGPIIAVLASKGGVGKSTIAVNLAIALKQLIGGRVGLVDGDLYFGDLATLLNVIPDRTINELAPALDAEVADRFLLKHSSGIELLAAPLHPEQAAMISAEQFRAILDVLQPLYDCLVVDVSATALDTMLATLEVADLSIVLSTLDVVCLKNVGQIIDMLGKLRFPSDNIMLVGNRYDERVSLDPKDGAKALGMAFTAVVPRDDRVIADANRGVPTIVADPGVPFTQKVRALAKMVGARIGRLDRVTA